MKNNVLARFIFSAALAMMLVMGASMALAERSGELGKNRAAAMAVENTDGGITTLVKDQLGEYPNVNVETNQGVVTLSGAVYNKVERDKVIDMVGRRGDVKGVVDNITIRNP